MGKGTRQKRDKRKSKKNSFRDKRAPAVLAYTGQKYKTAELVPVFLQTESAIHDTDVLTGRTLNDHMVRSALETLVLQMRRGTLPALEDEETAADEPVDPKDLIILAIRRGWQDYSGMKTLPGREALIGVLRTTLGSIEVWGSINPKSRGYLRYIEGFLKKSRRLGQA